MRTRTLLVSGLCALGSAVLLAQEHAPRLPAAPANAPAPSVQAPADPGYAAFLKSMCKNPPAAPGARGGGAGRGGGRGAAAAAQGEREYNVTAIPGVIAAGQKWQFIWQQAGNNGDGIVGTNDGGVLVAQNDSS